MTAAHCSPNRAGLIVGLAVTVAFLTGCGEGAGGTSVKVVEISRPNGDTVECATTDGGGIDCNWESR